MYNQKYTLHTHTIRFDGQNTIAEMVAMAKSLGFDTIGFANHFIVNPSIKLSKLYHYSLMGGYYYIYSSSFREALAKFRIHYKDIEDVRNLYPDMRILRGMEVDFFDNDEWKSGFKKAMEELKPDYVIGSAHFIEHEGLLLNTHDWKAAEKEPGKQDILLETYWKNVAKAAESGLFTWMAHLDLPKKVGLGSEPKWMDLENRAVEAAAKSNTAIEINTSFYDTRINSDPKDCREEPYPSDRILQMAKQNNVPVLLSDDAHRMQHIGRHFDKAAKLIEQFNLKTFDIKSIVR